MILSVASGQPSLRYLYYAPSDSSAPLGCGSNPATREPFPDGTPICVYWDANHAIHPGPDSSDVQVTAGNGYGQSNFACGSLNGEEVDLGAGYFYLNPALLILRVVSADSSWYYLKICGDSCQWYSTSFQMTAGPDEVSFAPDNWSCSSSGCSFDNSGNGVVPGQFGQNNQSIMLPYGEVEGLTLCSDPGSNKLVLRWPGACLAQSYSVYSSTNVSGPYETFVDETTDTILYINQPVNAVLFYTVEPIMPWDQLGVEHNRALAYINSLTVDEYDTAWTDSRTIDSVKNWTLNFLRDSTCLYSDLLDSVLHAFDPNESPSYDWAQAYLDTLQEDSLLSSREATYLARANAFVFLDDLSRESLGDCIQAFVDDILAISWNENETGAIMATAILYHSWLFCDTGWNGLTRSAGSLDSQDSWKGALGADFGAFYGAAKLGGMATGAAGPLVGAGIFVGVVGVSSAIGWLLF